MERLYKSVGISRQAHHKKLRRLKARSFDEEQWVMQAIDLRKKHPRMGARKLYALIDPEGIGRDQFEKLLFSRGLKLKRRRNYTKTTQSHKWRRYDNLISGKRVRKPYQVLVSDITYLPVGGKKHMYLFLILDIYTKKVVGWKLSQTMVAENIVTALKRAGRGVDKTRFNNTIFHSDGGRQYLSKVVAQEQQKLGMKASMGNKAWENAHAENINGVLKNEYINFGLSADFSVMERIVNQAIKRYNTERPHGALKMKTPESFEREIERIPVRKRPVLTVNY